MNLYTYCHNNPTRYVDPSGHFPWILAAVVICCAPFLTSCDKVGKSDCVAQESTTSESSQVTTSTCTPAQTTRPTTTTTTTTQSVVTAKKWTTTRTNIEQYKIDFVEEIYNKALALEPSTGIPAAIVTAQACQESGYGVRIPTDKNTGKISYNLFGIKGEGPAGSVLCETFEYYNGQKVVIDDYFKAFNSYDESLEGHAKFLHDNSNYDFLFESSDLEFWAKGLQEAGYATDINYANNLINVMNYWGLE